MHCCKAERRSFSPFTQGLRPFCLHCAMKAERKQNGCLGCSMVVHRMFRHRHGRHGRREVLSMFKTVAQRSPRRSVAHRSLKGGRRKAHTSPWWQNGCTVVGHWSPRKKYVLLSTFCINLSNASAFLVPPLCLFWPTNSVHWAITVATTVPPFGDHRNPSATLAMVLPPLCLLCATCCANTAALVVQWRHKGRAAAVTQKQNFLGLGDHWASWPFFWSLKGGTKVAALCKGGFTGHQNVISTLCVLNFSEETKKHTFTFYVIALRWCDTGSWNPSSSKTRTYLFYIVNIMAAEVLATKGARASATMILT